MNVRTSRQIGRGWVFFFFSSFFSFFLIHMIDRWRRKKRRRKKKLLLLLLSKLNMVTGWWDGAYFLASLAATCWSVWIREINIFGSDSLVDGRDKGGHGQLIIDLTLFFFIFYFLFFVVVRRWCRTVLFLFPTSWNKSICYINTILTLYHTSYRGQPMHRVGKQFINNNKHAKKKN